MRGIVIHCITANLLTILLVVGLLVFYPKQSGFTVTIKAATHFLPGGPFLGSLLLITTNTVIAFCLTVSSLEQAPKVAMKAELAGHSMTFCRGLLYAAASLLIGIPATSQVNTEIPKSPAQHIRITHFVDDPSLGNPFPSPELEPLHKAAFTIHNDDDREVVALCVIWQVTNTLGKTSTITVTMDEYLSTMPSIAIAPHGKLSMAPCGFLMPQQGIIVGAAGGRSDARLATRLADAQSITVWVDSIIYADGTLWGPNVYGFDKRLTGRKAAAIHIAQVARQAMAHNEDPTHALKPIYGRV